ncbi:MAG: hypothetical protein DLM69_01090 [Candidatus Chloroheliales bacterium]|nr:MAG: hypothetical protein DLM69_01090 [Chloroflexota bacterium]
MPSTQQKGGAQTGRSGPRSPKSQSKVQTKMQAKAQPKALAPSRRPQQGLIPWYFWVVLGAVVVLGVVLVGTFLGNSTWLTSNKSNTAAQSSLTPGLDLTPSANVTPDARSLLTNGYGEGNPNAAIKAVEYGDFQCPSCKIYFDQDYSRIKQTYIDSGQVYYYYKPLPLVKPHPKAMKAAEVATCAGDYGTDKFWAMHDLLYANQDAWVNGDENTFWAQYAQQLGLDSAKVMDCVAKDTHQNIMNANINEAISIKIPGTPQFYINDKILPGANFDTFKQAVETAQK